MKKYMAAIVAIAALPSIAQAQTSYTNKAAFLAAAGSTQTETFGAAAVGNFASVGGVFNAAFDGFNVTGNNFGNYVGIATGAVSDSGPNYAIPGTFTGQKYLTWANLTGGIVSLTINFNAATTAFGFDWFNTDFSDQYSINLPGGTVFSGPPFTVVTGGAANSGFFGLISSTPFTSVVITNNFNGGYISDEGMDNFITNGVGSVKTGVPEPATWAMMLIGFGAIGFALRRRTKVRVAYAA